MSLTKHRPQSNLLPTQPYTYDNLHSQVPTTSSVQARSSSPTIKAPKPIPYNALASSSKLDSPRRPPSRTEKKFICTHPGCGKAYFKPSRLAEHELTHSGIRPHSCPYCEQTYLRASHLTAHLRTHLSQDDKPFECTREGCGKRFWTMTHLKRHEGMHDGAEVYSCEHCDESFNKAHLLRDHITLAHMPPGTKPWPCTHPGCDWSFTLKHQLKTHEKTHDPTRYTCSDPSHGDDLPNFSVWSALQAHIHKDHPPTCPHEECNGRTFKSTQKLQKHLKVHSDHLLDLPVSISENEEARAERLPAVIEEGLSGSRKRRRAEKSIGGDGVDSVVGEGEGGGGGCDGQVRRRRRKLGRVVDGSSGKEWVCEHDCGKSFKTKYALETHIKTYHLKIKIHHCPHPLCTKSYAHQTNLTRHLLTHSTRTSVEEIRNRLGEGNDLLDLSTGLERHAADSNGDGEIHETKQIGAEEVEQKDFGIRMGEITGSDYAPGGSEYRRYGCPYHLYHLHSSLTASSTSTTPIGLPTTQDLLTQTLQAEISTTAPLDLQEDSSDENGLLKTGKCYARFWRIYDVRRHLKGEHGVEVGDGDVRRLVWMDERGD